MLIFAVSNENGYNLSGLPFMAKLRGSETLENNPRLLGLGGATSGVFISLLSDLENPKWCIW
jgi:hypothetical protein